MEYNLDDLVMIQDKVSIELIEKKQEKIGKIYVPEKSQTKKVTRDGKVLLEGVVHNIGPEADKDLNPGDRVIFNAVNAGTCGPFYIVKSENIFLVLEDEEDNKKRKRKKKK